MREIRKILLCTDGETHSAKAEEYAVALAKLSGAEIVGLYVVNPFLKKFTHEIYAVNRNECRKYLDERLKQEGESALNTVMLRAVKEGIQVTVTMRYGDPADEILDEIKEGGFDMVILGAKLLRKWKERFESFNLPEKIFRDISVPVLFVR